MQSAVQVWCFVSGCVGLPVPSLAAAALSIHLHPQSHWPLRIADSIVKRALALLLPFAFLWWICGNVWQHPIPARTHGRTRARVRRDGGCAYVRAYTRAVTEDRAAGCSGRPSSPAIAARAAWATTLCGASPRQLPPPPHAARDLCNLPPFPLHSAPTGCHANRHSQGGMWRPGPPRSFPQILTPILPSRCASFRAPPAAEHAGQKPVKSRSIGRSSAGWAGQ